MQRLGGEHPRGQGLGRVVVQHRHDALQQNRPVIVLIVDEVDGAAAHFRAIFQHGFVHVVPVHAVSAESRNQ